jgi:MoaA/NifB/PqqE/SkfB family radical SAM enzyme
VQAITLITTLRCDLKCAHCLRDFPEERPDFPVDLLPRLLVEAKPYGVKHVSLTGGEPHLHPDFEHMVEMIVAAGNTWAFVSNGMQTDRYDRVLARFGAQLTGMAFSLDGATAEVHDTIRNREGAFELVTASISHYVEQGYTVKIKSTLNRKNRHQLGDLARLAGDLGASGFEVGAIIPTPWNTDLQLRQEEMDALFEQVTQLTQQIGKSIGYASMLHTRGGVNFCNILNLGKLTFNPRGELIFCCDTINYGAVIGSLRTTP